VIGPSGSGKEHLSALHQPARDRDRRRAVGWRLNWFGFRRAGDKLHPLSENEIARQRLKTGMVFQRFNLFPHMTALENVIEGPVQVHKRARNEVVAEARALLDRVGLAAKCDAFSDRPLRRPAAARRDRAGARDETSADAVRRAHLGARSGTCRRGAGGDARPCEERHDHGRRDPELGFARDVATRVMFMDQGRIVETGTPERVLSAPQHEAHPRVHFGPCAADAIFQHPQRRSSCPFA